MEQLTQNQESNPLARIDFFNEIFNLWFELSMLRKLVNDSIQKGQASDGKDLLSHFPPEAIDEARQFALEIVKNKFSEIQIGFTPPASEAAVEAPKVEEAVASI